MKRLVLLRHAKSSWDDPSLSDHARPLSPRGRRAAPAIAAHLRDLDVFPEVVHCSTSERTRETLRLALEHLGTPYTEFDASLYLASAGELLGSVHAIDDAVDTAMLIGHNPGMHALAAGLTGSAATPESLDRLDRKFPTAAVAVLEFDVRSWRDVDRESGHLIFFVRPRDLTDAQARGS
jgi:phosphohistidine phosphatase